MLDAKQNMLSCCSCSVTVNGSPTLSVINNLLPGSSTVKTGVIEVLSSTGTCSAGAVSTLAPELDGWLSHWIGSQTIVEQQLELADLSASEFAGLGEACDIPGVHACSCGAAG